MDPSQFFNDAPGESASTPTGAEQNQQVPPSPHVAGEPERAQQQQQAQVQEPTPVQQPGESDASFEDRLQAAENRARELEQQNQQFQQTFSRVQQWAEEQARQREQETRQQRLNAKEQEIRQRAESMPAHDAWNYVFEETRKLREEEARQYQQQEQQIKRQLAAPMYIDYLVQQHGLPAEAKQELMAIGDPDIAARYAPQLKARYDQFGQLQQQIHQLSRTQQAERLQQTGVGMVGGTTPPGGNVQLPDDPDDRAIAILRQLNAGTYQQR